MLQAVSGFIYPHLYTKQDLRAQQAQAAAAGQPPVRSLRQRPATSGPSQSQRAASQLQSVGTESYKPRSEDEASDVEDMDDLEPEEPEEPEPEQLPAQWTRQGPEGAVCSQGLDTQDRWQAEHQACAGLTA